VFRFAPKAKRDGNVTRSVSKEARRVCVLNEQDSGLLEHGGVGQPCHGPKCRHSHLTREAVEKLVQENILRYVRGSGRNVAGYSYGRTWKAVPSDNVKVMQLV